MLLNKRLDEKNFLSFAMKMYDNPTCKGVEEFEEDLSRVKYVKRLLNKYKEKKVLKKRLLLNHIIIMTNVFGTVATNRILFYKIESELHHILKSVLEYLNILAREIPEVELEKIPNDPSLVKSLEETS
jgi:hypothetical protein|tara:strand:+ start:127 stop:510 length:384 start_codon:yes stop_codon:yes gene_type:complete